MPSPSLSPPRATPSIAIILALAFAAGIAFAQNQNADDLVDADASVNYLLLELENLIDARQFARAEPLLERMSRMLMSPAQRNDLSLQHARLRSARGEHAAAIEILRELQQSVLPQDFRAQLLAQSAEAEFARNNTSAGLLHLIARDALLPPKQRAENQNRIIETIIGLHTLDLSLLQERDDAVLNGWIVLADVMQTYIAQRAERKKSRDPLRDADLRSWLAHYPDHPADPVAIIQLAATDDAAHQYKRIALLLPLTSQFGAPARAFHDGFMAAHANDASLQRPSISVHDIGADFDLTPVYYRAAIKANADFVVGPLGRHATRALLQRGRPSLPTLVISSVPPEHQAEDLFGINLSPEREAQKVAERAFADGHRQVGIFYPNSDWGRRVGGAFDAQWRELGGEVMIAKPFAADAPEYSRAVKNFLGVDASAARARLLGVQLNAELRFVSRRRDDLDFVFLVANANKARLIVPQMRFSQAHDLPLYSTSHIFSGAPNAAVDADLDGVMFADIAWMVRAAERNPARQNPAVDAAEQVDEQARFALERSPYHHTALDRLYALGWESYHLAPMLDDLRKSGAPSYQGATMRIRVGADGNAERELVWAEFAEGLPTPIVEPAPLQ